MHEERKPKTQTENAGGDGPGRKSRIGAGTPNDGSKRVRIDHDLTVKELAKALSLRESDMLKYLFYECQLPRTLNQILELTLAREIAIRMGYQLIC